MTGVNRTPPPINWQVVATVVGSVWGVLAVGLIAAKLEGSAHISWLAALSPIWAPLAVAALAIVVLIAFGGAKVRNPFQ